MPTHDYIIANGTGAAVRADINLALSAIVSLNSSATEPGTMYAYQLWADTATGLLKIRNGANSAWITLRQLDGDFSIVAVEDGLQATPSLTFTNDLNTGIFRPGNDSLAIVTGATRAITITSTQAVGIQTANPSSALHVAGNARVGADDVTDAHLQIGKGATGNRNSYIDIVADTTYTDYGLRIIRNNTGANATSELKHRGTGALNFTTQEAAPIVFNTTNSPALTILAGGNVGIGATPTGAKLSSTTSDVGGTIGDTTQLAVVNANGAVGDFAGIRFNYFNDGNGGGKFAYIGSVLTSQASNGSADIVFGTRPTSTTTISERARIRSDGMFEVKGAGVSGSSPAFSVSGSAPANSAIIDTSGRLLIGTTNARSWAGITGQFQLEGTGYNTSSPFFIANSNDGYGSFLTLGKTRGTAVGSSTIVQNNDYLGEISFIGADGSVLRQGAGIAAYVDGTPGANDMPGRLVFSTNPGSPATSPTERMRIDSLGNCFVTYNILMDSTGTSGGRLYVNGTSNNQSIATSSSGAGSTTLYIGNAAIQVSSDARLKNNIENTQLDALDAVERIKVKDFTWNDPTDTSYNNRNARGKWTGLIAQELVDVLPFAVNAPRKEEDGSIDYDSDSIWTLDQSQLCPVLIKAVQQQQEIIAALESRITALESA